MMGLSGRQRSLTISSAIWIECTNVTVDRRTDGQTDTEPQQRPRLRIASRGKNRAVATKRGTKPDLGWSNQRSLRFWIKTHRSRSEGDKTSESVLSRMLCRACVCNSGNVSLDSFSRVYSINLYRGFDGLLSALCSRVAELRPVSGRREADYNRRTGLHQQRLDGAGAASGRQIGRRRWRRQRRGK